MVLCVVVVVVVVVVVEAALVVVGVVVVVIVAAVAVVALLLLLLLLLLKQAVSCFSGCDGCVYHLLGSVPRAEVDGAVRLQLDPRAHEHPEHALLHLRYSPNSLSYIIIFQTKS